MAEDVLLERRRGDRRGGADPRRLSPVAPHVRPLSALRRPARPQRRAAYEAPCDAAEDEAVVGGRPAALALLDGRRVHARELAIDLLPSLGLDDRGVVAVAGVHRILDDAAQRARLPGLAAPGCDPGAVQPAGDRAWRRARVDQIEDALDGRGGRRVDHALGDDLVLDHALLDDVAERHRTDRLPALPAPAQAVPCGCALALRVLGVPLAFEQRADAVDLAAGLHGPQVDALAAEPEEQLHQVIGGARLVPGAAGEPVGVPDDEHARRVRNERVLDAGEGGAAVSLVGGEAFVLVLVDDLPPLAGGQGAAVP